MRDYEKEYHDRVAYVRNILAESGMNGIVYGNSGGKDSGLVGILCKAACENTLGVIMPCASRRNFSIDKDDALTVAKKYGIDTVTVDLTSERNLAVRKLSRLTDLTDAAVVNIAPRLRMLTLYTLGASTGRLVAGTGNRSEAYMGYFTKWGDGAYDFDPIADLTVTEIYEFLDYLHAPECICTKAPSAGLFDGQTDEDEMGVTYAAIDACLLGGEVSDRDRSVIEKFHTRSAHKRRGARNYPD
jgi:NAD+ synthetase